MAIITATRGATYSKLAKELQISEAELKRANPGVKTLKTGQGLNVPSTLSGGIGGGSSSFQTPTTGTNRPPPKGGNVRPVSTSPSTTGALQGGTSTAVSQLLQLLQIKTPFDSFGTPSQPPAPPSIYIPPSRNIALNIPPPRNALLGNALTGSQSQPYLGASSYLDPRWNQGQQSQVPLNGQQSQVPLNGQQSLAQQPYLGASSYLDPRWNQGQQSQVPLNGRPALPFRPDPKTAPYTGNPNDPNTQLWINYWNEAAILAARDPAAYQVAMGIDNAPKVMTREEIRRMKQEQHRRQEAQSADSGGYGGGEYGSDPYYPEIRRSIVWST